MKNATPKLSKRSFTTVEQACHEIQRFSKLYRELQDKVTLSGQTQSTLKYFTRKMAHLSLHFGKLPQHIDEREINRYLASLARNSTSPSLSDFKFTIYGLRYCYRLLGMNEKVVKLPSIKREEKLPVVLNYPECRALFKAPELLKHRVLLSLMYSAGHAMGLAQVGEEVQVSERDYPAHVAAQLRHVSVGGRRGYCHDQRPAGP